MNINNTYEFPYGKYEGQCIRYCNDINELLKFIYYPYMKLRMTIRRRLHELGHVIEKEEIKRKTRIYKYYFPNKSKINIKGKLIFTTCKKHHDTYYAIQIYRCYGGKLVWLYTFNPPTDQIGTKVKLQGTILHKSSQGKPVTLLVQTKQKETE